MRRREFITLLGGAAAAWPLAARSEQPNRVWHIGYLGFGPASAYATRVEALRAGLRDLGWVEGKNIVIEFRWADSVDELPALAAELVRLPVDVIFASSSTLVEPARQATQAIPIVFSNHADPVGIGHVASLARPGGNITGLSMLLTDLAAKELEILTEVLPQVKRIGVLWNPTTPSHVPAVRQSRTPAKSSGSSLSWCLSEPPRTSRARSRPWCENRPAGFWSCRRRFIHRTVPLWRTSHSSTGCRGCSDTGI
jgi:putative tryptophan/tyrosine transport system substrate-binding protein